MIPFYFGASDRALYGVYDPPARAVGSRGAVLCNAMGRHYFTTHRVVRLLARRLSEAGVHALRFDYPGTGDSALEPEQVGWDDRIESVRTAVAEMGDLVRLDGITLIGLGAGASLASAAVGRLESVDRLVLWEPAPIDSGDDGGNAPEPLRPVREALVVTSDDTDGVPRGVAGRGCLEPTLRRVTESRAWLDKSGAFGGAAVPRRAIEAIVEWSARP